MTHDWYEQQHHKQHIRPRAVSPAIATIALIGLAIVAVGAVGGYVMSQSSVLKQDLSADILEVHLVQLRENTCEWNWGFTIKNTGTVPITWMDGRIRQNNGNDWWVGGMPDGWADPGESRRLNSDGCVEITPGRAYQAHIQIYYDGPELSSKVYTRTIVAEGL